MSDNDTAPSSAPPDDETHDGPETGPETAADGPVTGSESDGPDMRYERLCAALDAGWTGDQARQVAERLTGSTPEELATDAAQLAEHFPPVSRVRATDPSQGLGNDTHARTESLADTIRRLSGRP